MLLGPAVNGIAIVLCALLGRFALKGIPLRFEEMIRKAIGLSVVLIGISGALENQRIMILILSMFLGSALGELLNIEGGMQKLGDLAERKLGFGEGDFSRGFVTATILFCTGSMAIVGGMNSGLMGNHELLFAKAILDGVISIVFASSMGIGVAFSALPVFVYEGAVALCAGLVKEWMTEEIIAEMSAAGSLVIAAIGLNFLIEKQIRVANMIPAIFFPWLLIVLGEAFGI